MLDDHRHRRSGRGLASSKLLLLLPCVPARAEQSIRRGSDTSYAHAQAELSVKCWSQVSLPQPYAVFVRLWGRSHFRPLYGRLSLDGGPINEMKEVLTIQVGSYANWVGAHFWNLQLTDSGLKEAPDTPVVSFGNHTCPFAHRRSKVYTEAGRPRLLLFDVREEINYFCSRQYESHDQQESYSAQLGKEKAALLWDGATQVHEMGRASVARDRPPRAVHGIGSLGQSPPIPASWSQAWRGETLDPERHCVEAGKAHDMALGAGAWGPDRGADQLHRLLEECDAAQGLHLLLDLAGPASSLGVSAAQEFAEEVRGGVVACYAFAAPDSPPSRGQDDWGKADAALGVKALLEAGCLLIPSSRDPGLPEGLAGSSEAYRTSAVQATALEAVSGVYREDERVHMREWAQGIRVGAWNLAAVEIGRGDEAPNAWWKARPGPEGRDKSQDTATPSAKFLSSLVSLAPRSHVRSSAFVADPVRRRRLSGLASAYGFRSPPWAVRTSLEEALKGCHWLQPHLNFVSPDPLPLPPPLPGLGQAEDATGLEKGSAVSLIGCTSAVGPFVEDITESFAGRGPGLRRRLREERGLLEEDLGEVDALLADVLETGVPREAG